MSTASQSPLESNGLSSPVLTVVSDFRFSDADLQRVAAALAPGQLLLAQSYDALADILRTHPAAQIVCSFRPPANLHLLAPGIRWVQLPSAGADGAVEAGLLAGEDQPIVTTSSGIHAIPMAEYTFSSMLLFVRHWRDLLDHQHEHVWPDRARWATLTPRELHGATLGIIGLGHIGHQIAMLGRAFGMRTLGLRRSITADQRDDAVDHLYASDGLHDLLGASDVVVIAVPRTPATHHLIDEAALRRMRTHAYLVNIARGDVVDEAALIRALRQGWIGGAGLDVTEHEPLEASSPFWSLPNVILSPHISGSSEQYSARFTDLFLDNLARFRGGQTLRNIVDAVRGY